MEELLERYGKLLSKVDHWFAACLSRFPDEIACGRGCSECCRSLFDITLLDAMLLRRGLDRLPDTLREDVLRKAEARVSDLGQVWPEFSHPYILNCYPEEKWEEVLSDAADETPCVLLGEDGHCLLYDFRPMTCRLHGLPQVDISGEVMDDAWCTKNFTTQDPLSQAGLRGEFVDIFRTETSLIAAFNELMTGIPTTKLDTLISAALLVDFVGHDWRRWLRDHSGLR